MRKDFAENPTAEESGGSILARIYHDIGLAAVAEALDLIGQDFGPDMAESLERGSFYLLPSARKLARTDLAA